MNEDINTLSPTEMAKMVSSEFNPKTLIPFPFEAIIDAKKDISIVYHNLMGRGVSGAIVYENSVYKIIINSFDSRERQYFTLAHEFGHYFLHKNAIKNKADGILIDEQENYEGALFRAMTFNAEDRRREIEANEFAAELLMPSDKIRDVWEETNGKLSVEYYAKMFCVSVSAMAIKMERLGLRTDQK